MLKNSKDIKGIELIGTKFLLSQYVDDTSIMLDGTEHSFKEMLHTLEFYAKMSGLKINIDKTEVIWTGSTKNSKTKFCP